MDEIIEEDKQKILPEEIIACMKVIREEVEYQNKIIENLVANINIEKTEVSLKGTHGKVKQMMNSGSSKYDTLTSFVVTIFFVLYIFI